MQKLSREFINQTARKAAAFTPCYQFFTSSYDSVTVGPVPPVAGAPPALPLACQALSAQDHHHHHEFTLPNVAQRDAAARRPGGRCPVFGDCRRARRTDDSRRPNPSFPAARCQPTPIGDALIPEICRCLPPAMPVGDSARTGGRDGSTPLRNLIPTPGQIELSIYGNDVMDLTSFGLRSI